MYKLKHSSWNEGIILSPSAVSILALEGKEKFYSYCTQLSKTLDGDADEWVLTNIKSEAQKIAKLMYYEPNVIGMQLTSKKLQTALYKKCGTSASDSAYEYEFRKTLKLLYELCRDISTDVGYDITLNDEYDPIDVFKLFSLEIKDEYPTLLLRLVAFINIHAEFFGIKVFSFLFLSNFLTSSDLWMLHQHCISMDICLLLIEPQMPSSRYLTDIETKILLVDEDNCEIAIN